jgi:putative ABC transport system permease protein
VLSALAVVLGITFVSGTFIFTDTLNRTFSDLFGDTQADVELTPTLDFASGVTDTAGATIPASVLGTVEAVPGVSTATGYVLVDGVRVIGENGKVVGVTGAPAFGVSWSDDQATTPFRLVPGQGRGPEREGEIALDSQTVETGGFEVGDTIELVTPGPTVSAELVGVFRFGTSGNLAGASLTAFDLQTAQELLLDGADAFTGISVDAADGQDVDALAEAIRAAVPDDVTVQTGQEAADEAAADISQALSFVNIFLLVFAAIALLVGSFIILNTFSMLVVQRSKELALLRALGASRGQVTFAVLGEALIVGLVGSIVGVLLSIPLASGLNSLLSSIGFISDGGGVIVQPRTVIVSLVVGVAVTLFAAFLPARRASKVPPVAAMRDDLALPQRSLRIRTIVGAVLAILGAVAIAGGISGDGEVALVGLGVLAVFFAAIALAPVIGAFAVRVIGAPFRGRISGRLAVDNARRNRRRTAGTASALMIGLALVGTIATLGSSATASTDAAIERTLRADFVIADAAFTGFSPQIAADVAQVDGIAVVSQMRMQPAQFPTGSGSVTAIDPATIDEVAAFTVIDGSIADLTDDGIMVDRTTAERDGVAVGDTITLTYATGQGSYTIQGLTDPANSFATGYVVTLNALEDAGIPPKDVTVFATTADGANLETVRAGVDSALAPYPMVTAQDQSELKEQIRDQISTVLAIVYGLLALSLIISVLGIVNTLALSVIERTREIGLLRAVGMSRRQLRASIRVESIVIAVFGSILGVLLGALFGWALQQSLASQGIDVLSIPVGLLVAFIVVAAVVGVVAALWPARRAARMDVLQAIANE